MFFDVLRLILKVNFRIILKKVPKNYTYFSVDSQTV